MSRTPGKITALTVVSALALSACSSGKAHNDVVIRAAAPASRPVASAGDLSAASASTNALGLDLLRSLAAGAPGSNVVVSPTSITTALSMLAPGARGKTAAEMATILHSSLPADRLAVALGALDSATVQRATAQKTTMQESDTLWLQKDYQLQQQYLNTLAEAFDTGAHETDFTDGDKARKAINTLVEQQTGGIIKNLFEDPLDPATRLVLTDALFLKAKWDHPFEKNGTAPRPFHVQGGAAVDRTTMSATLTEQYSAGPGWQYTEIPYAGDSLAMGVLLPAAGTLDTFRKGLDAKQFDSIVSGLRPAAVDLELPKFTFDYGTSLKEALQGLGMTTSFSDGADFGGIPANGEPLKVSDVVHKAHVAVDEDGTTAAAATGVSVTAAGAAAPPQSVEMHVDQPFLFLIRDTVSGQILFIGQVTDPQSR